MLQQTDAEIWKPILFFLNNAHAGSAGYLDPGKASAGTAISSLTAGRMGRSDFKVEEPTQH